MEIAGRHWMVATAAALTAHLGVVLTVLSQEPPSGARAAGLGGIEVSLGPAGGAPGDVASVEAVAETKTVEPSVVSEKKEVEEIPEEQPETIETAPRADDIPERQPETVPTALPVEPVVAHEPAPLEDVQTPPETPPAKPLPLIEEVQLDRVKPVEIAEAVAVNPPPPPKRKPVRKAETVKPVEARDTEVVPGPATAKPVKTPEEPNELRMEEQVAAAAPSVAGAGGRAGTLASTEAGTSSSQASGGGLPAQGADYMSVLQAWLEKHKKYPRGARARRQEGTALLYFVMDRDGRIGEYRIQQSSGHTVLDKEVLALLQRAKPLPAPPPEVPGREIKLIVPVQFFLR